MESVELDTARFVRRIFLKDNMTNPDKITYLSELKLVIAQTPKKRRRINVPYFDVKYNTIETSNINKSNNEFKYEIQYTMNLEKFWQATLGIFIGLILFVLILIGINAIFYYKTNTDPNNNTPVLLSIVSIFFNYLANLFWFIVFAFGIYFFIFFKGQRSVFMNLPPPSEFEKYLNSFMWLSFSFKLIGIIFTLIVQNTYDMYIIDWEIEREGAPVSAWRRINIASEWNKALCTRSYSMIFTCFFVALLLDGLHIEYISNPTPLSYLWNTGNNSPILRYTFDGIIWICLFLFQYLWYNSVYWFTIL